MIVLELLLIVLSKVLLILLFIFPPDILFTKSYILLFITILLSGAPAKVPDMPRRIGY